MDNINYWASLCESEETDGIQTNEDNEEFDLSQTDFADYLLPLFKDLFHPDNFKLQNAARDGLKNNGVEDYQEQNRILKELGEKLKSISKVSYDFLQKYLDKLESLKDEFEADRNRILTNRIEPMLNGTDEVNEKEAEEEVKPEEE